MYFHSKKAWPPPTYDFISHNHRNWTSLNSTQNARKWMMGGGTNSYWKHQLLVFWPLRWRWHSHPSSPLYIWGLILFLLFYFFFKQIDKEKKTSGKKQCYKSLAKGKPENNEISTLGIIYLHIASFSILDPLFQAVSHKKIYYKD